MTVMRLMRCCAPALFLLTGALAAAQSYTLSGKVVDARSGQPLPHSIIELNPTTQRSASLSTVADEEGKFSFTQLPAGKYQLSGSRRGYLTQSFQQHDQFSTAVAVGRDLPSVDLLFPLTPQSVVYGTVTDEAGEPVRRARVRVFSNGGLDGGQQPRAGNTVMTDDLGKYELADLLPGDYYLSVSAHPWYARGGMKGLSDPPDPNAAESSDSLLNVAYPTGFYLNATDPDDATPIPLRGGERLQVDLTLSPQHAMRLLLPLPIIKGASYNVSLSHTIFGVSEQMETAMMTGPNGEIILDGVLPGHYDVIVNQFGESQSKSSHFASDVAAGSTTLSPSEVSTDVTVSGKVFGIEDKPANPGISLLSRHPQRNYYANLDAGGAFTTTVEPGTYEVIGHIAQMYLARVTSPNATVHGRMLEVKPGASPQLEIVAAKGYGQVDGIVTAGNQKPGGVMVLLAPDHPADNHILFRRDQSDSDGTFTLANIIPGRYRLYAIENGWNLNWQDPEVLHAFDKKSIPLEIHAGEKLRQSVEVQTK